MCPPLQIEKCSDFFFSFCCLCFSFSLKLRFLCSLYFSLLSALQFSSVQFSFSVVSDSLWPHELQHARPPCPSPAPRVYSNSCPLSRWCHPAISSSVVLNPSIPPSIRVFSNESTLPIRWSKYWTFSFTISPYSEHPGLISFRMDWLDLLAVQGTLLQHHSSKASILRCSAFFIVQLSHPYMTTGKTIAFYTANIASHCSLSGIRIRKLSSRSWLKQLSTQAVTVNCPRLDSPLVCVLPHPPRLWELRCLAVCRLYIFSLSLELSDLSASWL